MGLPPLACPNDGSKLKADSGQTLVCERGHSFPVVDGVPVLFCTDVEPTMNIMAASLARARNATGASDRRNPSLFLESVGISEAEKEMALNLAVRSDTKIDPVVSVLVGATNGIAYKKLIGKVFDYPIPDIRLPESNGSLLLDIGCSWGRWSIAAARKGYRVVGIDPSLGAIMAARRVIRQLNVEVDFICGDGRHLPFPANTFDTVFSYSVIQHFSKTDALLTFSEIGRVLRPDGESLVQIPGHFGLRSLYHQWRRGFTEGTGFEVRYWKNDSLKIAMEQAVGPSNISAHCYFGLGLECSDMRLMSPVMRWVLRLSNFIRQLSKKLPFLTRLADSVYVSSIKQ